MTLVCRCALRGHYVLFSCNSLSSMHYLSYLHDTLTLSILPSYCHCLAAAE